jgi:transcription initiation factor IIF auxiliary subunit
VKREETKYTDTILRVEKALEEKTRAHAKLVGIERRHEARMTKLAATSATALEASTLALVQLGESESKKFNIAIAAKQRMISARDVKIELLQGTVATCKDEAQAVQTAHAEAITELDAITAQRLSTIRWLSGKQGGRGG